MAGALIPATRAEALQALRDFADGPVLHYAARRNLIGEGHPGVSRLSAAVAHRLLTEAEIVRAVLQIHKPAAVEKFLQEVVWRSYWKGWLESHPGVWRDFAAALPSDAMGGDSLRHGRSGCAAMDACARELVETGYLHNHARMWWASFWIHRARLPWRDGARFFLDHLLDADAASNTLSWRWVAGLQTQGKTYLVRRSNLEKYWPGVPPGGLDRLEGEVAPCIPLETADRARHDLEDLPESTDVTGAGLLIHEEDLSLESGPLRDFRPAAVFLWRTPPTSEIREAWLSRATGDASARAEDHYQRDVSTGEALDSLKDWVESNNLRRLVLAAPFVGPVRDSLEPFLNWSVERGLEVARIRRRWDSHLFPYAKAGFFPFWNSVRLRLADLVDA